MTDIQMSSGTSPPVAPTAVNSQVTDAVTQTNVSVLAVAPAEAMGLVYQTMAQSISLAMQNGVTNQSAMQQINTAVVSTSVQRILAMANSSDK